MKKTGIVTLNGYFNYGNRLQNYAMTQVLQDLGMEVYTIWDKSCKRILKDQIKIRLVFIPKYRRYRKFYQFSRKYMKEIRLANKKEVYDFVLVGSDQVWNPRYIEETPFLLYKPIGNECAVSYAASFGTEHLSTEQCTSFYKILKTYKAISVREQAGKEIVQKEIGIEQAEVLIDPTMLLNVSKWDKIKRKPGNLNGNTKYLLKYFLGDMSVAEKKAISDYAEKNGCQIIDLKDEQDSFFCSGPDEFIYLVEHAHLVCTDSFHACVFSFLYHRPFVVFERKGCSDYMYSRIRSFLEVFQLKDREFKGDCISEKNQKCDYKNAYDILKREREKGFSFLKRNLT